MQTVWSFSTARFVVELAVELDVPQVYDGDDEDGETQRGLDDGELVMFDSCVSVRLKTASGALLLARDWLGASCYEADKIEQFWTAHRDADPMNRNCSIMRAKHPAGPNVSICHYFPDMVRTAIAAAREELRDMLAMRDMPAMRAV